VRAAETFWKSCAKGSHGPDGKIADALASTHACTTANALVNRSGYVLQRPCNVPIALMGSLLTRLTRPSLPQLRPTLRSTSVVCTCRRGPSKVPIAPMGNSRFARCLQGGGVYVSYGTVTITSSSIYGNAAYTVRAHDRKFPSPRWEIHVCSLYAGRRCYSLWRLSVNRELPDLLQHSCRCACSRSKFPIATMGDSRFD
jgi:hypothetical protein